MNGKVVEVEMLEYQPGCGVLRLDCGHEVFWPPDATPPDTDRPELMLGRVTTCPDCELEKVKA